MSNMPTRPSLALAALLIGASPIMAIGNPASDFCESRGGKIEFVAGANGVRRGFCVLPDGSRVDEWVYFRNTHRTTQ